MLHGEIKINGRPIQSWSAVRQDSLEDTCQVSEYLCTFEWSEPHPGRVQFPLMHRYDKGAAALAMRVLTRGMRLRDVRLGEA